MPKPRKQTAALDGKGVLYVGTRFAQTIPKRCEYARFMACGKKQEIVAFFGTSGGTHTPTRDRGMLRLCLRRTLRQDWPELAGERAEFSVETGVAGKTPYLRLRRIDHA